MPMSKRIVIETKRAIIQPATSVDAPYIHHLWTDPRVMRFVGFPYGLRVTQYEIEERIRRQPPTDPDTLLIATHRDTGARIGQCKLGTPGVEGISEPDIKLHPASWGFGFGTEIWSALIDALFRRTACQMVQGTPHVANTASIRMQQRSGMACVGHGVFQFPPRMRCWTRPVPHEIRRITREAWTRRAPTAATHDV